MKKGIIIGIIIEICILILISSVTAISNKDRILQLLGNYEEECLEYKYVDKISYIRTCMYYTDYGTERRECYKNISDDSWRKPKQERIVEKVKTDKCIKWHLVRYEKLANPKLAGR